MSPPISPQVTQPPHSSPNKGSSVTTTHLVRSMHFTSIALEEAGRSSPFQERLGGQPTLNPSSSNIAGEGPSSSHFQVRDLALARMDSIGDFGGSGKDSPSSPLSARASVITALDSPHPWQQKTTHFKLYISSEIAPGSTISITLLQEENEHEALFEKTIENPKEASIIPFSFSHHLPANSEVACRLLKDDTVLEEKKLLIEESNLSIALCPNGFFFNPATIECRTEKFKNKHDVSVLIPDQGVIFSRVFPKGISFCSVCLVVKANTVFQVFSGSQIATFQAHAAMRHTLVLKEDPEEPKALSCFIDPSRISVKCKNFTTTHLITLIFPHDERFSYTIENEFGIGNHSPIKHALIKADALFRATFDGKSILIKISENRKYTLIFTENPKNPDLLERSIFQKPLENRTFGI